MVPGVSARVGEQWVEEQQKGRGNSQDVTCPWPLFVHGAQDGNIEQEHGQPCSED